MGRADHIDHFLAALFVLIPHKLREVRATLFKVLEISVFVLGPKLRIDVFSLGISPERFFGSAFLRGGNFTIFHTWGISGGHFSMLTGKTVEKPRFRRKSAKFDVFFHFFFTFLKFPLGSLRREKRLKTDPLRTA